MMRGPLARHIIMWIAASILWLPVIAQQEISGFILDRTTGTRLVGANIVVPGLRKGTSTDGEGRFVISGMLPPNVSVRISYVGYRDTLIYLPVVEFRDLMVFMEPDSVEMASVVITAYRSRKAAEDIPQRVDRIDRQTIEDYPATNTDNLLKMIPGINVNRSWGIFSRNASVTMRGMPGSSRNLILLDGIPLNKTAGGTVNWHLVTPEEIDRIEVVKGPGSTLYGNNAMGGVINIMTRQPQKKLSGFAEAGYGTYNTVKGQFNVGGNNVKESRGVYWRIGSFYRQGDGYLLEPGEISDSINVDAYLKEGNANGLIGYQLSGNSKLELDYRYYKDIRGSGVKVYEEDGSFESFTNNNLRLSYEGIAGKLKLNTKVFYLKEAYYRQSENVNATGEYKLVDTETDKDDYGLWFTLSGAFGRSHRVTAGLDLKNGSLDNHEIYRTSTDDITTRGNLFFSAVFLQDEIWLKEGKFRIVAGLRLDHASFYNGTLDVVDPTGKTGFPGPVSEKFAGSAWIQLSPRVAFNYSVSPALRIYVSASKGFMPPRLDDLAGSRKIRRGFKAANPDLMPEILKSYEYGMDLLVSGKLRLKPSLFYSRGDDFQYLVATGDYIDSGSDDPVPVYQRRNISKVEVAGGELGVEYPLRENMHFTAAYTYNHSKILDYKSSGEVDLSGNTLNEVPANIFYLGWTWRNRILDLMIDFSFTDEQWYDEENTEMIESYSVINLRLSRSIAKGLRAALDIQDLFDEQYIDRKGYLSPGRFIMFEINYTINKGQ